VYRKDAETGEGDYFAATRAPKEAPAKVVAEPKKQVLQVDIKFRDTSIPASSGPSRGGRGAFGGGDRSGGVPREDRPSNRGNSSGRGRGAGPDRGAGPSSRGAYRTNAPAGPRGAINTDDSAAFPKLGTA